MEKNKCESHHGEGKTSLLQKSNKFLFLLLEVERDWLKIF